MEENIIRPTVKLKQEANKIFDKKYWLEHKEITSKRYNKRKLYKVLIKTRYAIQTRHSTIL